jgi:hypothetical protein
MLSRKLELNFETNSLSIVSTEAIIDAFQTFLQYVNLPNHTFNVLHVLRINAIDPNFHEFKLISEVEFYEIVGDYIKEFNIVSDEIQITTNKIKLEDLTINETNYVFDDDLCSFTLYSITM